MFFAPLHLALFLLVLVLAALLLVRIRRARLPSVPSCGACGYAVPHDQAQVCPECGGRYTVIGLRSSIYCPLAVWSTATTRGGLLVGAVLVTWLGAAIVMNSVGSKRTNMSSTDNVTLYHEADEPTSAGQQENEWGLEFTLAASGPTTSPPTSMRFTLRPNNDSTTNGLSLQIDAITRTFQVLKADELLLAGPYKSPDTVEAFFSQIAFPSEPQVRAVLVKHVDAVIARTASPTNVQTGNWSLASDASLPPGWFTTSSGASSASSGISESVSLAIMISGIVATFLTIALWLVHCRMLLTADKLRRQRLIEADGVA